MTGEFTIVAANVDDAWLRLFEVVRHLGIDPGDWTARISNLRFNDAVETLTSEHGTTDPVALFDFTFTFAVAIRSEALQRA